jgi:hypothetical protein
MSNKSQSEYSSTYGSLQPSLKADSVVYEIDSFSPEYSKIIVKQGFNPQPPDNSVILEKSIDKTTGLITLTCGVYALNPDRIQATKTATSPNVPNSIVMQADRVNAIERSQDTHTGGAVLNATFDTTTYEKPTSALDGEREQANRVVDVLTKMPSLVGQRMFESDIINETPDNWIWMLFIVVLVIVGVVLTSRWILRNASIPIESSVT